jgi:hypothetical protein
MLNGNFVMSKNIRRFNYFYGNIPLSFYSIGTNISESRVRYVNSYSKLMLDLLRIVPVRNLFTFADV